MVWAVNGLRKTGTRKQWKLHTWSHGWKSIGNEALGDILHFTRLKVSFVCVWLIVLSAGMDFPVLPLFCLLEGGGYDRRAYAGSSTVHKPSFLLFKIAREEKLMNYHELWNEFIGLLVCSQIMMSVRVPSRFTLYTAPFLVACNIITWRRWHGCLHRCHSQMSIIHSSFK